MLLIIKLLYDKNNNGVIIFSKYDKLILKQTLEDKDFMLDEKILKSWVNDITYKRAKKYYEGDYVEKLKIDTQSVSSKEGSARM